MIESLKIVGLFENKLRYKGYAVNTIDSYSYYFKLFIDFTGKRLSHLTKKDAYKYLDFISGTENTAKNHTISALKLFYKHVLSTDLDKIKTERPRKSKRLPRIVEWDELITKINRIKNMKHKTILSVGCRCALRVSEVCDIKIEDIDTESKTILIRNSKGNRDRYVPISDELLQMLFNYCEEYDPIEYLFNGQFGNKYSVSSCQKIFKKYIDNTKSFHTCRHSGATQMLNNGINLRTIQSILGHSSSRTSEIYTHVSNELILSAAL